MKITKNNYYNHYDTLAKLGRELCLDEDHQCLTLFTNCHVNPSLNYKAYWYQYTLDL